MTCNTGTPCRASHARRPTLAPRLHAVWRPWRGCAAAGAAAAILAIAPVAAHARGSPQAAASPSAAEARAIREASIEARLRRLPTEDATAHFELAEELAELGIAIKASPAEADAAMAETLRVLVGELCGWAVRLDASLASSSLRLMLEVETDPLRRRRLRRLLRLDPEGADAGNAAAGLEVVRALAAMHRGDRRGIEDAFASPGFAAWLDEHPEAVAVLEPLRAAALRPGGVPPLEREAALRLFEIEWAWLSPARAGFAPSLRVGGGAPLPEIGREELSQWLGAGKVRSWEIAPSAGSAPMPERDRPAEGG